jgi:hypothetical protein
MGRGLSKLQRTILEMAHERFEKCATEDDFKGLEYQVYVGPGLPTSTAHYHREKYERHYTRHRHLLNGRRLTKAAIEASDADLEHIEAEREKIERNVAEITPDLIDRFEPGCLSEGALRNWESLGDDAEGVPWDSFVVGGRYGGIQNNSGEARRILERVKDIGGWYRWQGYEGVYTCEILEHEYGFEPCYSSSSRYRDYMKFNPEQIGEDRYNAARASVSRALKRLEGRMLIEHSYGKATITLEGIAALTGLTVNEVCNQHNINRTNTQGEIIIRGVPLPPPKTPEEVEKARERGAIVQELRNQLAPPPPPLADQLFNLIARYIVASDGASNTEIEEAFSKAMQRIQEESEKAAHDADGGVADHAEPFLLTP